MRIETASARTWLLAAVAGWGATVWLLTLLGMGTQVSPKSFDPGLVKPLPVLAPAATERLGPLTDYAETSARPLFHRSRQPQPFYIQGNQGEQPREFDFLLTSVMITPGLRMAILQRSQSGESVRLKVGEAPALMPNWRLVEVAPRSATFDGPEGPRTLELRAFDGTGGQAPTPRAVAVPPASGDPAQQPVQPSGSAGAASSTVAPAPPQAPDPSLIPEPGAADSAAQNTASTPVLSADQQMGAIRKRIEARRAELRQSAPPPAPPNNTK